MSGAPVMPSWVAYSPILLLPGVSTGTRRLPCEGRHWLPKVILVFGEGGYGRSRAQSRISRPSWLRRPSAARGSRSVRIRPAHGAWLVASVNASAR